jgi:hypothetical protein
VQRTQSDRVPRDGVVAIVKPCRIERVFRLARLVITCACVLAASSLLGCKKQEKFVSVGAGKKDAGKDASATSGEGGVTRSDGGAKSHGDAAIRRREDGAIIDTTGATMDAAVLGLDAAIELPDGSLILQDGAILLPDGRVIDVDAAVKLYTPEIDVASCAISQNDTWSKTVDVSDEGGYALVAGQTGFGLAFRAIGNQSCAREIDVAHIPATSGFPEPHAVLPDCNVIKDVTLLGTSDGWRLAWVDNFTEMAELHTLKLDLDMNVPSGESRRQLTDNTLELERKPVLDEVAGQTMAAWITESNDGRARITTQLLDGSNAAIDVIKPEAGHNPQGLALSQMGTTAAALGWVGPQQNPGVWLQKLDANGAAVDSPMQLTDKVAVSSSIALADRINGGGAVYSIEIDGIPQVRFRRLDETGQPLADERSIVGPPLRAMGASIDTLGGGYAIAYRALPGGGTVEPEIRLTFITKEGNVIRDSNGQLVSFPIGPATMAEGRTYVAVSVEGEIMVAWIDGDPNSGKNLLKMVRRRLDCR